MFAPPIKAPKAKTASSAIPAHAPKPPQHMPLRPGASLSNQVMLQPEARKAESLTESTSAGRQTLGTDRTPKASTEIVPYVSWDFSKIPVFAPDPQDRHETARPLIQPKLAIGPVNDPLEHEADRIADLQNALGPRIS